MDSPSADSNACAITVPVLNKYSSDWAFACPSLSDVIKKSPSFTSPVTRIGSAPFKGSGSSIKKSATDTAADGMAYRIYACGIRNGEGIDPMVVPLESVVVLPK